MSKKTKKEKEMITENDLKNTYFVPMARMKEVIALKNRKALSQPSHFIRCDYNLLNLKHERSTREYYDEVQERYAAARHKSLFVSSCYKALYAHDWDRLLYILKRVPRWRFQHMHAFHTRILTILLMFHPESQAKGYFNEYLHMVWGCRTDPDKKAIQKTLLTLRKRMYRTLQLEKICQAIELQRKEAFAALAQKYDEE